MIMMMIIKIKQKKCIGIDGTERRHRRIAIRFLGVLMANLGQDYYYYCYWPNRKLKKNKKINLGFPRWL